MNIITDGRADRADRLKKELEIQGITDFEYWDAVFLSTRKEGINAGHRQIVEYAKLAEWPEVAIAEDDIKFTHPNSWKYFLSKKPDDFDIYLGGIYLGDIDNNNVVKEFCGFHLYIVHERFYDKFLNVKKDEHIDRSLSGLGKYVVCNPFAAIQYNGWSSNTGKEESYDQLLLNRKLYNG